MEKNIYNNPQAKRAESATERSRAATRERSDRSSGRMTATRERSDRSSGRMAVAVWPSSYDGNENSRGSILIFSVLILGAMLSVMFGILGIFMPKLKIISDPIKSSIAAFAADTGSEWCLYINRGKPNTPPQPVLDANPAGGELVPTYIIYSPASDFTVSTCTETDLDHRIVGTYQDVARSFELYKPN